MTKYLIPLLLLVGCTLGADCKGIPKNHFCCLVVGQDARADIKACYRHIESPKFKIGEKLRIKDDRYSTSCRFIVKSPAWTVQNRCPKRDTRFDWRRDPSIMCQMRCDDDGAISKERKRGPA